MGLRALARTADIAATGSIIAGMKYLVIAAFVGIIGSLVAALVFMMRGGRAAADTDDGEDSTDAAPRPGSRRMARALAVRVGLSVLLFVIVLLSYLMGWIQPTGLPVGR